MFTGKQVNPYDEIVAKTTDENLTSENWELILNLCDKVNDEGETGARNVIAALLKRLAHRNPNVQLYSLALAEALSKNCGNTLHREMASRSFTQALEKLVADRTTHEKVKRRTLYLISLWTGEFENNPQLGMMDELYQTLKAKNYKFEQLIEPPPPTVDDEVRRKEEEELQRVLEMSLHDKGGRDVPSWRSAAANNEASGSKKPATANLPGPSTSTSASPSSVPISSVPASIEPSKTSYPTVATHHRVEEPGSHKQAAPSPVREVARASTSSLPEPSTAPKTAAGFTITRVRALHTFEPTVAGELAFEKGDIIKVTDRAYDNWWRGQLKGRTGIFPVNYVEPLPDLTSEDLAREAEQEAAIFAQAANIDKLVNMLKALDPAKDNLADNDEIQELYRLSMALRPKIVKLIDKYSQKRAELVAMNENFVKARGVFEEMMEESLARHTGVYENSQPTFRTRTDSRTPHVDYHPSGWNHASGYEQPGYNAYSPGPYSDVPPQLQNHYQGNPLYADSSAYSHHHQPGPYGGQIPQGPPSNYPPVVEPVPYASPPPHGTVQGPSQQYGQVVAPTDPKAYTQQNPQAPATSGYPQVQPQPQLQPQLQPQPQPQVQLQPQPQPQVQPQSQPQLQAQSQPVQPQPQSQLQPQPQSQLQPQPQSQLQPQPQPQGQSPGQPQQQLQPTQQQQQGPPYVYDPNMQYADPNVQAWAQYYAQGGTDPTGAVYFISIPGVTDTPGGGVSSPTQEAVPTKSEPTHQSQSPTAATQIQTQRDSTQQPTSPTGGHSSQTGPSPINYQPYNNVPQSSPPADHEQYHQSHIQPGYQPPSSAVDVTEQKDDATIYSGAPQGVFIATQAYGPPGYGMAPLQQADFREPASSPHYQRQGSSSSPIAGI